MDRSSTRFRSVTQSPIRSPTKKLSALSNAVEDVSSFYRPSSPRTTIPNISQLDPSYGATVHTPVAGNDHQHHYKSHSLIGFDPFVNDDELAFTTPVHGGVRASLTVRAEYQAPSATPKKEVSLYGSRPASVRKAFSVGSKSPSTFVMAPPFVEDIHQPIDRMYPTSMDESIRKTVSADSAYPGITKPSFKQRTVSLGSQSVFTNDEQLSFLKSELGKFARDFQPRSQVVEEHSEMESSEGSSHSAPFDKNMDTIDGKKYSRRSLPWRRHQSERALGVSPTKIQETVSIATPLSLPSRKRLSWRRSSSIKSIQSPIHARPETPPVGPPPFGQQSSPSQESPVASSPMIQELYEVLSSQKIVPESNLHLPSLAKPSPTSFLTGREIVTSSEPSKFQLEVSKVDEIIVHSRLCQFIENYRNDCMDIDLQKILAGVPRLQLQTFVTLGRVSSSLSHLSKVNIPVIKSFLSCADDVELVSFFSVKANSTIDNKTVDIDDRREVAIFQRQRQFIVVFRGTTFQQQGKAFNKATKKSKGDSNNVTVPIDSEDQSIQIYDIVRENYMDMESRVFQCLNKLTNENPFCDVVFAGHSFGAALATLAAYRYAAANYVVRVTCHVFGSPKIGNAAFRTSANSLTNLKVVKIEYENDPKCHFPTDGCPIGHSIAICNVINGQQGPQNVAKKASLRGKKGSGCPGATLTLHRFDDGKHHKPSSNNKHKFGSKKMDWTMQSYSVALEKIWSSGLPWVDN